MTVNLQSPFVEKKKKDCVLLSRIRTGLDLKEVLLITQILGSSLFSGTIHIGQCPPKQSEAFLWECLSWDERTCRARYVVV